MQLVVSLAELDVVCVWADLVVSVALGLVFAQMLPWRDVSTYVLAHMCMWVPRSGVECARGVELGVVRLISGSMCFGRLGELTVSCGEFALDLSTYGEVMRLSHQPR